MYLSTQTSSRCHCHHCQTTKKPLTQSHHIKSLHACSSTHVPSDLKKQDIGMFILLRSKHSDKLNWPPHIARRERHCKPLGLPQWTLFCKSCIFTPGFAHCTPQLPWTHCNCLLSNLPLAFRCQHSPGPLLRVALNLGSWFNSPTFGFKISSSAQNFVSPLSFDNQV